MKIQSTFVVALLLIVSAVFAQNANDGSENIFGLSNVQRTRNLRRDAQRLLPGTRRLDKNDPATGKRIAALEKIWQASDADSDDREKAEKMLETVLNGEFDSHLDRQRRELEAVEERVKKLRERLERRLESRGKIVELQSKQILMSWQGLGWDDNPEKANAPTWLGLTLGRSTSASDDMTEELMEILAKASDGEDQEQLLFMAKKYVEQLEDVHATEANNQLWHIYESAKEKVDSEKFWKLLAIAGERAAKDADPHMTAATLDTVAHLYDLAGDREKAVEFQKKAVAESNGESAISEFLERLNGVK